MGVVTGGGGGGLTNPITVPLTVQPSVAAGNQLLVIQNSAGGTGSFPLQVVRTPGGANAITVGTVGFNGDVKFWADWDNDNSPTLESGGTAGVIKMVGLPAADPGVSGQLYTVAGVLHVSP